MGSIRALIALLPAAIRALIALFRYRSIRALGRPLACGNTGSGSGYVLVSLRAYAYAARLLPVGQYAVPVFGVAATAK